MQPIRPFLKWAGGKSTLLGALRPLLPERIDTYREPFLGGGALAVDVLSRLAPPRVVLTDRNPELIEAWQVVRDDVEALIEALAEHAAHHDRDHYLRVRAREGDTPVARAARTLYLNKTGFNGLYRLNKRGRFNVPPGRYARPAILDAPLLRRLSALLQGVTLGVGSFEVTLADVGAGEVVYLDPPYHPSSATAAFTAYDGLRFTEDDQRRLAATFRDLVARGAHVVLSNSDTPFVRELYAGFELHTVEVARRVNVKAGGRGRVSEVIVVGRAGEAAGGRAADGTEGRAPDQKLTPQLTRTCSDEA